MLCHKDHHWIIESKGIVHPASWMSLLWGSVHLLMWGLKIFETQDCVDEFTKWQIKLDRKNGVTFHINWSYDPTYSQPYTLHAWFIHMTEHMYIHINICDCFFLSKLFEYDVFTIELGQSLLVLISAPSKTNFICHYF